MCMCMYTSQNFGRCTRSERVWRCRGLSIRMVEPHGVAQGHAAVAAAMRETNPIASAARTRWPLIDDRAGGAPTKKPSDCPATVIDSMLTIPSMLYPAGWQDAWETLQASIQAMVVAPFELLQEGAVSIGKMVLVQNEGMHDDEWVWM